MSRTYHIGDRVRTKIAGVVTVALVICRFQFYSHSAYALRRPGLTRRGTAYPTVYRSEAEVEPDLDRPTANVYADFLEDNGEPAAAAKLRREFPLALTSNGGGP